MIILLSIIIIGLICSVFFIAKKLYKLESRFSINSEVKNYGIFCDYTRPKITYKDNEDIIALIETIRNENWNCNVEIDMEYDGCYCIDLDFYDKEYDGCYCIDLDFYDKVNKTSISSRVKIKNKILSLIWFRLKSSNPMLSISFDNLDQKSTDIILNFINEKIEENRKSDLKKQEAIIEEKKKKLAIITKTYKKSENINVNIGKLFN